MVGCSRPGSNPDVLWLQVLLEQGGGRSSIAERMQDYQVIAMVVLIG